MTRYDEPNASDGKGGPHPLAGVPQAVLDAAARYLASVDNVDNQVDFDEVEAIAHGVLIAAREALETDMLARLRALEERANQLETMAHTHEMSRPIPDVERSPDASWVSFDRGRGTDKPEAPLTGPPVADASWEWAESRGEILDILRGLANNGHTWIDGKPHHGPLHRLEDWRYRAHRVLQRIDT